MELLTIEQLKKARSFNKRPINKYFENGKCAWCEKEGNLYAIKEDNDLVIYVLCASYKETHPYNIKDINVIRKLNEQEIFILSMIINGSLAE